MELSEILRMFSREYEKDPKRWNVFTGHSNGYHDLLISGPEQAWRVKYDFVTPYEIASVGEEINEKFGRPPSYGFRPIDERRMRKMMKLANKGRSTESIIENVMRRNPVTLQELFASTPPLVALGPFDKTSDVFSEKQRALDVRLRRGLDDLIRRKHPQTLYPYG